MDQKASLELKLYDLYDERKELETEIKIYQSSLECIMQQIAELESILYA